MLSDKGVGPVLKFEYVPSFGPMICSFSPAPRRFLLRRCRNLFRGSAAARHSRMLAATAGKSPREPSSAVI